MQAAVAVAVPNLSRLILQGCAVAVGALAVMCNIAAGIVVSSGFIAEWLPKLLSSDAGTAQDTQAVMCACMLRLLQRDPRAVAYITEAAVLPHIVHTLAAAFSSVTRDATYPTAQLLDTHTSSLLRVHLACLQHLALYSKDNCSSIAAYGGIPCLLSILDVAGRGEVVVDEDDHDDRLVVRCARLIDVLTASPHACCSIVEHGGLALLSTVMVSGSERHTKVHQVLHR